MAHRGDPSQGIENTLPAFAAAREIGAECVELDVRICADDELVVFHDPTLARMAGRGERLEELPSQVVRQIRLSRGALIPSLDEVFEVLGPSMLLDIEVKSDAIGRYTRMADRVVDCVRNHDAVERTLVSSFDPFVLRRVSKLEPSLRTGYLFLQPAPGLLAPFVRPYAVHPITHLVTREAVDRWRRRGYAIHPWTADGTHELRRLQALGVDAICTNEPAKALRLFDGETSTSR